MINRSIPALFFGALLIRPAWAHMNMVTPPPRRGENNRNYPHGIDYDLASPLGYDKSFPCGGAPRGPPVATYSAGSSISIEVDGSATHDGGHCQFAISYDNCQTFVVIKTIMSNCLTETGLHFDVPLPPNAPSSDHAVLSWSWINKTGNREYYMNCADIRIKGVEGGYIEGPELLVANLPGYPTIPEFTKGGYHGEDLFNQMRIIKVSGGGAPIAKIPQIVSRDIVPKGQKHNQNYGKSYDKHYESNHNNHYDKGHHDSKDYGKSYDKSHGNIHDKGHYDSYDDDCPDNEHFDYSNETYGDEYDDSYNGPYEDDYESYDSGYTDTDHFDHSNEMHGDEYDKSYNDSYEDDYDSCDEDYTDTDHFDYSNETYGDEYDDSYNGPYEDFVDVNSPQNYGQDHSNKPEIHKDTPAPKINSEYKPPSGTYIAGVDTYINPIGDNISHHYAGSDCDELQHEIGHTPYQAIAPHPNPQPQTPSYAADQGYNLSQSPEVPEPIEHVKDKGPLLVNSSPNNYY